MSYFDGPNKGYGWAAGHFLVDDENCVRRSCVVPADHEEVQERDNGRKVVPAGVCILDASATPVGILYEDVDVTEGAKMGSIVTQGVVYEDRLLGESYPMDSITYVRNAPEVTRPY